MSGRSTIRPLRRVASLQSWLLDAAPMSRTQARCGRWWRNWLVFRQNRLALGGLAVIGLLVLVALAAPLLASPAVANVQALAHRLLPPTLMHPFGTDDLGRDILLRVVFGARITLTIVSLVVVVVLPVGLGIGLISGYAGGLTDIVLMRLTDIFLAFPRLILALAFAAALGPGIINAVLAIALTAWPPYARLARGEALTVVRSDFVHAAALQGASAARIVWSHVLPLCLPSMIVRLTLDMAGIILTAAGLGFLGLGAQPPTPEWGAMVSDGQQVLLDQWWVATAPGLAIFVVSVGFNLLGDGLREVFDPRAG